MSETRWVFGWHAVLTALRASPGRVLGVWLEESRRDPRARQLWERAAASGITVARVPGEELVALVGHRRHQGVAAQLAASGGPPSLEEVLADVGNMSGTSALFLVLDGIQDPHNLGACLRVADAAGVRAVIVPKDRSVGVTPTVAKVACGAAETVPLVPVTNLSRALEAMKAAGVWVVGLAGEAPGLLYEQDLRGPLALVLGAEQEGLRRLTRAHCDVLVRLPMLGTVESLNVSVAAGIALYEAVRQRLH